MVTSARWLLMETSGEGTSLLDLTSCIQYLPSRETTVAAAKLSREVVALTVRGELVVSTALTVSPVAAQPGIQSPFLPLIL